MKRVKGARDLVFDGIEAVTGLVQQTHAEVSHRWTRRAGLIEGVRPIADSVHSAHMAAAGANYATIRLVSQGVSAMLRAATDPFLAGDDDGLSTPLRLDAAGTLPWYVDQLEGVLNGFVGDHLSRRQNGLDLGMTLRHQGRTLRADELGRTLADPTSKVCVFVHGLSATEWSWVLYADQAWGDVSTCYATKLQEELGYTPIFVRYNSGRHVSENGRALSDLIGEVCHAYPVQIEDLALVGHSAGGLVARSAAHDGRRAEAAWVKQLRHVFCIGSPHLGAPLAKGAHLLSAILHKIPAAGATVPAAVIDSRSDGIRDLRHGYTTEEEWRGEDPTAIWDDGRQDIPLVEGVTYSAVAGTITRDEEHPAGQLFGDLLVRKASASGETDEPDRHIKFHARQVVPGTNHLQLVNHPAVYALLRDTLSDAG